MSELSASEEIKRKARNLGFADCRVCSADPPNEAESAAFVTWLDSGMNGTMRWFDRSKKTRLDLRTRFPWARSVIVLRFDYASQRARELAPDSFLARTARYAQGLDYHDYLKPIFEKMQTFVRRFSNEPQGSGCEAMWYQDTGPVLEHVYAQRAGIGWTGKHTLTLHEQDGSYFFLGEIITSLELPFDDAATIHCGTCTACIDACPTDAIRGPFVVDARRCISYLTIEHKGQLEEEMLGELHGLVFGCDICQEVCPFNKEAKQTPRIQASEFAKDGLAELTLLEVLMMPDKRLEERLAGTPMERTGTARLKRNVVLVAAGEQDEALLKGVYHCLTHPEEMVRDACAWALGTFVSSSQKAKIRQTLVTHQKRESFESVRARVIASLQALSA